MDVAAGGSAGGSAAHSAIGSAGIGAGAGAGAGSGIGAGPDGASVVGQGIPSGDAGFRSSLGSFVEGMRQGEEKTAAERAEPSSASHLEPSEPTKAGKGAHSLRRGTGKGEAQAPGSAANKKKQGVSCESAARGTKEVQGLTDAAAVQERAGVSALGTGLGAAAPIESRPATASPAGSNGASGSDEARQVEGPSRPAAVDGAAGPILPSSEGALRSADAGGSPRCKDGSAADECPEAVLGADGAGPVEKCKTASQIAGAVNLFGARTAEPPAQDLVEGAAPGMSQPNPQAQVSPDPGVEGQRFPERIQAPQAAGRTDGAKTGKTIELPPARSAARAVAGEEKTANVGAGGAVNFAESDNPHGIAMTAQDRWNPVPTASTPASATAAPSSKDAFAALDRDPALPAPTWIHAGRNHAEAGYFDPALGWVGVRADGAGAVVHAAVVPSSAEAAQLLGTHLGGLNAYLAEHYEQAATVTMATPQGGGSEFAHGNGRGDGSAGRREPDESEEGLENARRATFAGTEGELAVRTAARDNAYLSSAGTYISVVA